MSNTYMIIIVFLVAVSIYKCSSHDMKDINSMLDKSWEFCVRNKSSLKIPLLIDEQRCSAKILGG